MSCRQCAELESVVAALRRDMERVRDWVSAPLADKGTWLEGSPASVSTALVFAQQIAIDALARSQEIARQHDAEIVERCAQVAEAWEAAIEELPTAIRALARPDAKGTP